MVVAAALNHTLLPRAAAAEAVVLAHRIRHLPSLPAVAVEGGVGLVVHVVEGEEVTVPAALAAVA